MMYKGDFDEPFIFHTPNRVGGKKKKGNYRRGGDQLSRQCNIPRNENPKCPKCRSRKFIDGKCKTCKTELINN